MDYLEIKMKKIFSKKSLIEFGAGLIGWVTGDIIVITSPLERGTVTAYLIMMAFALLGGLIGEKITSK